MEEKINNCLKDCFVAGFGVYSEFPYIDFAKINGVETYRLWIDSDIDINSFKGIDGLNDDQIELFKLNELRNLKIKTVRMSGSDDLKIEFEDDVVLKISFNPSDKNSFEPVRFYQLLPERRTIWICSRP